MSKPEEVDRLTVAIEKLCMVVAAQYAAQLGEVDRNEKAELLSRCGLATTEIAALLGSNTNAINVALHRARKAGKKRPARARKRR